MKNTLSPYAMPPNLERDLSRVYFFWQGLERGQANMPFSDDIKPTALPGVADQVLLLDVFQNPQRFRLGIVSRPIADQYGEDIFGKFVDELKPRNPLEYLASQCDATVESHAPTYHRHSVVSGQQSERSYARLLLPMWGDGHISMLLGSIVWIAPARAR
jgi:hypothetical protein